MIYMQGQSRKSKGRSIALLLYATIALCCLHYGAIARFSPELDTTWQPGLSTDTVRLNEMVQYYATWDTNRMDEETAQLYAGLSRAYAAEGDKQNAYLFFERYRKVKDSLFYEAKNLEIQKLKQDVAAAGQDKKLAEKNIQMMLNQELVSRKNAIVLGLAGSILLILILCLQSVKGYIDKRNLLKRLREQMDQDTAISMLHASMQGENKERDRISRQLQSNIRPLLQEVQQQLGSIERGRQDILKSNAFAETQQIVQDVQQELDDIAAALASSGIGTQGLVRSVSRFIRNIPKNNELSVVFVVTGKEHALAAETEMILYRILQELVQNIMKHAHANTASIAMDYGESELSIKVHDNGTGFDTKIFDQGIGWTNIQDRVLYLQGTCSRYNEDGTTILIRLPAS